MVGAIDRSFEEFKGFCSLITARFDVFSGSKVNRIKNM